MSTTAAERVERLTRTLEQKNKDIANLESALEGARARADEATRELRDLREERDRARRSVAAVETLREDLRLAREATAAAKHELTVARELAPPAPPAESDIVRALREAYDAKEAELRAELAEARSSAAELAEVIEEDGPQAVADQQLIAEIRKRLDLDDTQDELEAIDELRVALDRRRAEYSELEGNHEERAGWANMTQSELDDVAELLGLPKDGEHGRLREAVGALLQRAEIAEQEEARAREAEAAAIAARDEARRSENAHLRDALGEDEGDEPTSGVRARLDVLARIALKLGLRRNARPDVIFEAFLRSELERLTPIGPGEAGPGEAHIERLLVALWPGREDDDASPSPTLDEDTLTHAAERIAELRELADEWANGPPPVPAAPASGYVARLFDALMARVEAGDADTDVLDRLERIAKEHP